MVFHCLSIPYSPTKKEVSLCAFVQKVYKFCNEMTKRGHTVYHYGHADSIVNCTEHITVTNNDILKRSYSNLDSWKTNGFNQDVGTEAFNIFNDNCIAEINKRLKSNNEFILCWFGYGHKSCVDHFYDKAIVVEPSIGYDSMFAPIKIFETKCQMHKMHGSSNSNIEFGKEFSVYPGFYSEDFEFKNSKSDTALFLGRIIEAKGAKFAYDICNHIGQDIIFAGPNIIKLPDTKYCKFVGFVEPEQRKQLLTNAKFLFAPSFFIEPCNWTVIESQFSGTPTITTDFGGFSETVRNKVTGYRCSTQQSFIDAIKNIKEIKSESCYLNAINNFTMQKQCEDYEEIFNSLILNK